jgi:hypothetical protein
MQRCGSKFAERRVHMTIACATTALAAVVLDAREASAQACCVAPGAAGVARLADSESYLAGLDTRAQAGLGSFDADGRFASTPSGASDVALEQDVFASVRWLRRGQASVTVPFVETMRSTRGLSTSGAGIGDVRGSLRWDAIYAEDAKPLPGVAILAGVIAPTGTAPEDANDRLGADATGTGTTQLLGGLAFEELSGPWLAYLASTVAGRFARGVQGVKSTLSPRSTTTLLGAYAFKSGVATSLSVSYAIEGRATLNGEVVAGSQRRLLTSTFALQVPILDDMRLVGSIFAQPPLPAINAGEISAAGLSLAIVRPWS